MARLKRSAKQVPHHDIGSRRGCAIGNFGDYIEKVGAEPAGTAGNVVLRDALCGHDEIEHGRVAIYVASASQHAPEILRKRARGRANVNVRYLEFRLLGENGDDGQEN